MNESPKEIYEFEGFRVDVRRRLLTRSGSGVPLTPKAFETLLALLRGGGRLMTKTELLSEVWPDTFVEEGNLAQNIFLLRRALGEAKASIASSSRCRGSATSSSRACAARTR